GFRQPLNPTNDRTSADQTPGQAIRYDLWRGFQQSFLADNPLVDPTAQTAVNAVITTTETKKTHTFIDPITSLPRTDTYILGDISHSTPLVIGTPTNPRSSPFDVNGNNGKCTDDPTTNTDTGYRCFENRHANRRKVLLVGSNDGMLHAFDAGKPSLNSGQIQFDDGTGKEVWAYMPRPVMPTVKVIANGTAQHWTVDGSPQAADVFIDPTHNGNPVASQREWRTVAIAGLREGPEAGGINGYYALDVTQPDPIQKVSGIFVPQLKPG